MTMHKYLLAAGCLLMAADASFAAATIKVNRAGASGTTKGDIVISVTPDAAAEGGVAAMQLIFNYNPAELEITQADVVGIAPWTATPTVDATAGKVTVSLTHDVNVNNGAATATGNVMRIGATNKLTGFRSSNITLDPSSNYGTDQFGGGNFAQQVAPVINGKVRNFGGSSPGAIAVGGTQAARKIAMGVGNRLWVVNASDMTDVAGFAGGKDINGAINGRPSFGTLGGVDVIAAGSANQSGYVFNATTGDQIASASLGGTPDTAPAIAPNGNVYWAVNTAAGPVVVKMTAAGATTTSGVTGGAGQTVNSSPIVVNGKLIVGTTTGVKVFNVDSTTGDLTPAADAVATGEFRTSPVSADGGATALIGNSVGQVFTINISTGNVAGSVDTGAASGFTGDPFPGTIGAVSGAIFGGANGNLYAVGGGATSPAVPFSGASLNSPVAVPGAGGGSVYVADAAGKIGKVGAATSAELGAGAGKAIAVTGTAAGTDQVVTNTVDGSLVALTLE